MRFGQLAHQRLGRGPERTIIRYQGSGTRSVLDMRGTVYWQITGIKTTFAVVGGAGKDDRRITLSATEGISVGDVLLIDQLNCHQCGAMSCNARR